MTRLVLALVALLGLVSSASPQALPKPEVQTQPLNDNSTKAASTAFVKGYMARRRVNVLDMGATLVGQPSDITGFNLARAAAGASGIIDVPSGTIGLNSAPTAGSAGPVLWNFRGTTLPGGSPITSLGTDTLENTLYGRKWFTVGNTNPDDGPVVRIDQTVNHNGGTEGAVVNALSVTQTLKNPPTGAMTNFGWAFNTTLRSYAPAGGQHTALSALADRPADALSDRKGPRATIWPMYLEAHDHTGQPSNVAGSLVAAEWDIYSNGDDPGNNRIMLHMLHSKSKQAGPLARLGKVLVIGSNDGGALPSQSYIGRFASVEIPWDTAAFDTSAGLGKNDAPAYRMGQYQYFAFDGGNQYRVRLADGTIYWSRGRTYIYTLDGSGNSSQPGTMTAARVTETQSATPASSSAPCTTGQHAWDSGFEYRCVATNTWKRAALSSW